MLIAPTQITSLSRTTSIYSSNNRRCSQPSFGENRGDSLVITSQPTEGKPELREIEIEVQRLKDKRDDAIKNASGSKKVRLAKILGAIDTHTEVLETLLREQEKRIKSISSRIDFGNENIANALPDKHNSENSAIVKLFIEKILNGSVPLEVRLQKLKDKRNAEMRKYEKWNQGWFGVETTNAIAAVNEHANTLGTMLIDRDSMIEFATSILKGYDIHMKNALTHIEHDSTTEFIQKIVTFMASRASNQGLQLIEQGVH